MMLVIKGISLDPSGYGSARRCLSRFACSSVPVNASYVFNLVACTPQEKPTSGFYAELIDAVGDALSTHWGLCLKLKTSPTVVRNRSQLCAVDSLRDAATLRLLTAFEQSSLQAFVPFPRRGSCAAPKTGSAAFCSVPRSPIWPRRKARLFFWR